MLAERRFFFMDILKEGYLLHDSGRFKLARPPKELPPEAMLRHAEEYFEEWMDSANRFMRGAKFQIADGGYKIAAFDLHQSAERYITCLLLVHTGYRPKEHDMEKLLRQAAGFDPRFASVFPANTEEEKHLFDLLRRAYVDARYSKSYRITEGELKEIAERANGGGLRNEDRGPAPSRRARVTAGLSAYCDSSAPPCAANAGSLH